ncbi:alpha/beta hydrolase [Acinetobacter soli]|uniref:alpha/beta hydrolase n=1 Tax=Acinetobacter soli TaxID=487316 RepID=UPI002583792A|nr:alpha/beta hydrolase [uncultured Acinetobacter sp.]
MTYEKLVKVISSILLITCSNSVLAEKSGEDNTHAKVFLNYTQSELDKNYTQTEWAPNAKQIMDRVSYRSDLTRKSLGNPKIFQYGASANEKLDFYKSSSKNAPLLVFIHGGAWKSGNAKDYDFIANPFLANGISVAILDFDDVTKVGLDGMVKQIRTSLKWIYNNSYSLKINKDKIYIAGHSSGAHLAGVITTTNWESENLPKGFIKGAVLISGLYDMNPVRLSVRSKYINFNDKTEIDMSTIKRVETINVPLIVSYGSLESDEFKRQSDEFVKKLKDSQKEVKFIMQPYFNHFEIVEDYGNQYNPLTKMTIEMIRKNKI